MAGFAGSGLADVRLTVFAALRIDGVAAEVITAEALKACSRNFLREVFMFSVGV